MAPYFYFLIAFIGSPFFSVAAVWSCMLGQTTSCVGWGDVKDGGIGKHSAGRGRAHTLQQQKSIDFVDFFMPPLELASVDSFGGVVRCCVSFAVTTSSCQRPGKQRPSDKQMGANRPDLGCGQRLWTWWTRHGTAIIHRVGGPNCAT
jgi:hypothetical protein